ncbi:hypothetical protein ABI59_17855 [Acidobacteria bacterium Mor1]|nr:hypothetical protein ABI59_17855 [Acidobacteria bacterium Mor1]
MSWALYEPDCSLGQSTLEVPCGNYGVFHFGSIVVPAGCALMADAYEAPPIYAEPEAPVLLESDAVVTSGAFLEQPEPPTDWIAVIDFDDDHGESTAELAARIAGDSGLYDVTSVLHVLDDPELSALGAGVNDYHVLANVCRIRENVDRAGLAVPHAINMSFGRLHTIADPSDASCQENTIACQIERVLATLRESGARIVAAAGNQREVLFPSSLPSVTAVGMLDGSLYTGQSLVSAAWESPSSYGALLPGQGLCLDGTPLPNGSSYSSAFLAGWLTHGRMAGFELDAEGDIFQPSVHPDASCRVLKYGASQLTQCNDTVEAYFNGMAGLDSPVGCDGNGGVPDDFVELEVDLDDPTSVPGFARWVQQVAPTPESDPCVPCQGDLGGGSLSINMSASQPLPSGTHVASVHLRVDSGFFRLALTPSNLNAIRNGQLGRLLIADGAQLVNPAGPQPSLVFTLTRQPGIKCSSSNACFWVSSPITLQSP